MNTQEQLKEIKEKYRNDPGLLRRIALVGKNLKVTKIYCIATARDIRKDKLGWLDWGGAHRVVGYFFNFQDALDAVENNWCDIYENGYYNYAIIEELEEGLYPTVTKCLFFKWKDGKFTRIRKPKATKGFFGFTL